MKKFLFFLCYCFLLQAENNFTLITLGEACPVTGAVECVSLRGPSHPFESNITSFQALYDCLRHDFHDFTNPDFFTLYFDSKSLVNKYGITLAHDFPLVSIGFDALGEEKFTLDPEWAKKLPQVQEKYDRRINRFRQHCTSKEKIYFLRYLGIDKMQAKRLAALIHNLYPNLDFTLICVGHGIGTDVWDIPRVKNFYINTDLEGKLEWRRVFSNLGLISS